MRSGQAPATLTPNLDLSTCDRQLTVHGLAMRPAKSTETVHGRRIMCQCSLGIDEIIGSGSV